MALQKMGQGDRAARFEAEMLKRLAESRPRRALAPPGETRGEPLLKASPRGSVRIGAETDAEALARMPAPLREQMEAYAERMQRDAADRKAQAPVDDNAVLLRALEDVTPWRVAARDRHSALMAAVSQFGQAASGEESPQESRRLADVSDAELGAMSDRLAAEEERRTLDKLGPLADYDPDDYAEAEHDHDNNFDPATDPEFADSVEEAKAMGWVRADDDGYDDQADGYDEAEDAWPDVDVDYAE